MLLFIYLKIDRVVIQNSIFKFFFNIVNKVCSYIYIKKKKFGMNRDVFFNLKCKLIYL